MTTTAIDALGSRPILTVSTPFYVLIEVTVEVVRER